MRRTRHSAGSPAGPFPLMSELLENVLGLMHPRDVARAACVSKDWGAASRAAMRPSLCRVHDPARVDKLLPTLGPCSTLARLDAHEAEAASTPGSEADMTRMQRGVVNNAVRAVATEWLIEVCWDWKLDSTTVFLGVRYLDLWLSTTRVGQLSKFQGIAISCLRTAFQRSRDAAGRRDLSRPAAWADVCDGAASPSDVSAACRTIARLLRGRPGVRAGDTPKLQLRRLWYQLLETGVMTAGRVYVYMLASFLLHLSLLDAPLARTPPTLLATGALALALDVYGFDPWPRAAASQSPLLRSEVQAVMDALAAAQATTRARQLRLLWSTGYSYELSSAEWTFLRAVVASPAESGGVALESGAGRRWQLGEGGAAAAAVAAELEAAVENIAAAQQQVAQLLDEQQQEAMVPAQPAAAEQQMVANGPEAGEEVEQPAAASAQQQQQGSSSQHVAQMEQEDAADSSTSVAGPEQQSEAAAGPRRQPRRQAALRARRQSAARAGGSNAGGGGSNSMAAAAGPSASTAAAAQDQTTGEATPGPSAPSAAPTATTVSHLPFTVPPATRDAPTPLLGITPRAFALRDATPGLTMHAAAGAAPRAAGGQQGEAGPSTGGGAGASMSLW